VTKNNRSLGKLADAAGCAREGAMKLALGRLEQLAGDGTRFLGLRSCGPIAIKDLTDEAGGPVKVIEGMIEPTTVPATALHLISQCLAVTSGGVRASARGSASRAGCHRPQAPNITMSGRDRRVGSADRQDLVACWDCAVRRSLMPPDVNHGDAMGPGVHCTENMHYLPSQLQRRGISYAESRTEWQPAKHCKLYSSEIPDRP